MVQPVKTAAWNHNREGLRRASLAIAQSNHGSLAAGIAKKLIAADASHSDDRALA
jgi:hypothetical protein